MTYPPHEMLESEDVLDRIAGNQQWRIVLVLGRVDLVVATTLEGIA